VEKSKGKFVRIRETQTHEIIPAVGSRVTGGIVPHTSDIRAFREVEQMVETLARRTAHAIWTVR
jgi:hypothetical protein